MSLWLWTFWTYSFLGYLLERGYAIATHADRQARKCFLLLPMCPVYGLGALAVLALPDGLGCDLVIETAGTEITTRQAIQMTRKGATIVLVGYSKSGEMTLPMSLALDKELTFKTVFRYRHIYPMAIDAVASGRVNLKGIVTDIFDFDDIQNAMDRSVADKANIVKAVVKIAK